MLCVSCYNYRLPSLVSLLVSVPAAELLKVLLLALNTVEESAVPHILQHVTGVLLCFPLERKAAAARRKHSSRYEKRIVFTVQPLSDSPSI